MISESIKENRVGNARRETQLPAGRQRVLLVIPAYNRPEELSHLFSSLRQLHLEALELLIVVVDDCSRIPIATQFDSQFSDLSLTFIRNETNRGPAFSRNRGARSQGSDYVWFLDSDTEICHPQTLLAMVSLLDARQGKAGAVGGVLEDQDGTRKILKLTFQPNGTFLYRALGLQESNQDGGCADGLSSANLFLRRDVFERAGGFCQDLLRDEDNDLCMTLAEMGYSCYQDPSTVVLNKITDSGRDSGAFAHFADPKKYVRDLLDTRIALLARHFPWRLLILCLIDLVVIPFLFVQKKRGHFVTNRFNKAIPKITLSLLLYCAGKQVSCYFKGIGYFFGLGRPKTVVWEG